MISGMLFQEMLDKGVLMFERRRPQFAAAPTPQFQASLENLILSEAFNYVLNEQGITEDRSGLLSNFLREAKAILRKKAMDERLRLGPPQASLAFMGPPEETWRTNRKGKGGRTFAPKAKGSPAYKTPSRP